MGNNSIHAGDRPTRVRWLIFALASATSWFLYLHRYTWNVIRPELIEEYGFSNTELGTVFALFNLTYAFGQVPGGVVCDYFGPHLFLVAIIAVWSLVLPLFGTTSSLAGLGALRLAFGGAQAGCYPALTKVTHVWFPFASRTTIQGFVASFFGRSGGAMSSIVMATVLIGWFGLPWRVALMVMGAAGILFAVILLILLRNRPEEDSRVNEAEVTLIQKGDEPTVEGPRILPFWRVAKNRSMLVFIFQQFLNAGADNVYVALMGSYFIERGYSVAVMGLLASLPLWGGAFGGVAGGIINDALIAMTGNRRWSRSAVGFAGKFFACVFMFVALSQESGVATAWWLFVVKFFTDWTQPTVWGTCTDMGGRYSATTFSIINTAGSVGGIVSPLLFGSVLDFFRRIEVVEGVETEVTNFTPVLYIVAGMYLASAISWLFINCTHSLESDEK